MAQELSQSELEVLVQGRPAAPNAVFFDKAVMNVTKSEKAGRRIYDTTCFLKETQVGVTDWVLKKANPTHFAQYPEEYAYYLNNRQGTRSPSVDIIPKATQAEIQELIDYGMLTITQLVQAQAVPPHLQHLQDAAKVIQSVLQETNHEQKENIEENRIEAEALSSPDRQEHSSHVEQRSVPRSAEKQDGEATQRTQAGRRINGGGKVGYNWDMSIEM